MHATNSKTCDGVYIVVMGSDIANNPQFKKVNRSWRIDWIFSIIHQTKWCDQWNAKFISNTTGKDIYAAK